MSPKWLSNIINPPGPPKAKIELNVNKPQFFLGENLTGGIRISSDEEFDVTRAVVWLSCNENLKKTRVIGNQYGTQQVEYWDNGVIYTTSCVLFGSSRVPAGFEASYPFSLVVSCAAKETTYSVDHYVKWFLYAVLDVVGRPKVQTIGYEVQVGRPQVNQSSSTVVKEVQREVVLIPCSYCSGLMPQTSVFCPNCGARRKN